MHSRQTRRPSLPLALSGLLVGALLATPPEAHAETVPSPSVDSGEAGVWPLAPDPWVERGFEPPDVRWRAGHRGVDLLGHPAQAVRAPMAGTVSFVGRIAGRGVVTLSHGETRTTYEPVLSDLAVGDEVAAGARLGWLHPTGSHCAPRSCLHWGWRRGDDYLDPLELVGRDRIRLLPLFGSLPRPAARGVRPARPVARTPASSLSSPALGGPPWAVPQQVMPGGVPGRRPS